jgi:hypothetical protein
MSIPASAVVQVVPGVLSAGGAALDLNGVMLTNNTAVPIGTVLSFSNSTDVATFFGPASMEASLATVYFLGFDNSTKKPGALLFSQYPSAAVAGYMRGASLSGMTLAQLQGITAGTLAMTVDGTLKTSSSINLSTATSFSQAATIIGAAFTGGSPVVSYDPQRNAFVFTSSTTGASSSVSFATTGTIATGLKLTQGLGAVTSAGAVAAVPGTAMSALTGVTQNWATFMTTFEPVTADKLAFSSWVNGTGNRFAYVGWDTDATAATAGATTSWGYQVQSLNQNGTIAVYKDVNHAAFILGAIASIDFARLNGRITLAFKTQGGLIPSVTDQTTGATLNANGYNFIGAYATANDAFTFLYNGQISGKFDWADIYVDQIWLNAALQQALMTLLTQVTAIPYNAAGYALVEAACADPINAAINFGAIRTGVSLSALQIAELQNAAGADISQSIITKGYYLQIKDPGAQARALRSTPVCTLWYADGGAIQNITLASIVIE